MTREVATDAPCPVWCSQGHGHPYGPDGRAGVTRLHSGYLGHSEELGIEVQLIAAEWRDHCDGPVQQERPELRVLLLGHEDERTPGDLRRIAAVLLNAADAADKVFQL